ncbi:hypothetical protein EJ110_NYTH06217 [Nymphaea thermarum]|nr:hypothetical protein EJ110_NYTH06217 [Nymphaea thermarum]
MARRGIAGALRSSATPCGPFPVASGLATASLCRALMGEEKDVAPEESLLSPAFDGEKIFIRVTSADMINEAKLQLQLAGPLAVANLLQKCIQLTSIMFVGHLGALPAFRRLRSDFHRKCHRLEPVGICKKHWHNSYTHEYIHKFEIDDMKKAAT